MSPDLVSTTTAMSWLRAFIGRNPIVSSARPEAATNVADRRGVLGLALRELGERSRALCRRPAGTARRARRARGDWRGRRRRPPPRSRCRRAASDPRAGARRSTFGPVSGERPEFGRSLLPRRLVDGVRGDHLEAVDDEHVVDGPRAEHDAAAVDERRELQAARSPRDRSASSSSSGRRR